MIDFGCDYAVVATGARWAPDILDANGYPFGGPDEDSVFTPDDVTAGVELEGPIVIYDFDHYYMGGCLAELLNERGFDVTIATNANAVSAWTFMNNELAEIRSRLLELGVDTVLEKRLTGFNGGKVALTSVYRDETVHEIDCQSLIVVGVKTANDSLFRELNADPDRLADAGIANVRAIGDCRVPGAIAHAVYSGHECARTIEDSDRDIEMNWERPAL